MSVSSEAGGKKDSVFWVYITRDTHYKLARTVSGQNIAGLYTVRVCKRVPQTLLTKIRVLSDMSHACLYRIIYFLRCT